MGSVPSGEDSKKLLAAAEGDMNLIFSEKVGAILLSLSLSLFISLSVRGTSLPCAFTQK